MDGKARYKLAFGPTGFNFLPNIIGIFIKPVFDSNSADWDELSVGPTDWLSPLRLRQKNTVRPHKQFFKGETTEATAMHRSTELVSARFSIF